MRKCLTGLDEGRVEADEKGVDGGIRPFGGRERVVRPPVGGGQVEEQRD